MCRGSRACSTTPGRFQQWRGRMQGAHALRPKRVRRGLPSTQQAAKALLAHAIFKRHRHSPRHVSPITRLPGALEAATLNPKCTRLCASPHWPVGLSRAPYYQQRAIAAPDRAARPPPLPAATPRRRQAPRLRPTHLCTPPPTSARPGPPSAPAPWRLRCPCRTPPESRQWRPTAARRCSRTSSSGTFTSRCRPPCSSSSSRWVRGWEAGRAGPAWLGGGVGGSLKLCAWGMQTQAAIAFYCAGPGAAPCVMCSKAGMTARQTAARKRRRPRGQGASPPTPAKCWRS